MQKDYCRPTAFTGNMVSVLSLKVHPKNEEYFAALSPEKYAEIKRSIEAHGIRDPLKVLPDYTVVAGHQRLKIAKELGLEKVPVSILDISPEEAEYLLIADNEERRQDDNDPMRKARRAQFLKEYWGIKRGGSRGNQYSRRSLSAEIPKTLQQIADTFGESKETLARLLKLNDLISPLQELVSLQKLSRTAAYSLAFLPPEEQEALLTVLGESGICGLSVNDASDLRAQIDSAKAEKDEQDLRLAKMEAEKRDLVERLAEATNRLTQDSRLKETITDLQQQLFEKQAEAEVLRAKTEATSEASVQRVAELLKEKARPKPPQPLKECINLRGLMEEASQAAARLATALSLIVKKHPERFLSVARVRGTPNLDQLACVVGDALMFSNFDAALDAATDCITQVRELQEPSRTPRLKRGHPALKVRWSRGCQGNTEAMLSRPSRCNTQGAEKNR